jgi:CO/xanthine dehydrogenase Mo-binding subunit
MKSREDRLVSGKGRFTDDLEFPNLAHMTFVGSPYAHARIVSYDVSKALAMKGVLKVITGTEISELTNPCLFKRT